MADSGDLALLVFPRGRFHWQSGAFSGEFHYHDARSCPPVSNPLAPAGDDSACLAFCSCSLAALLSRSRG